MEKFPERVRQARQAGNRQAIAFLLGLMVLGACFAVYGLSQTVSVQRSYIYPFLYQEEVEKYSSRYGVDKYLAAAVIRTESRFKNDVHSHRGAVGLMQLMPDTARWIAVQLGDSNYSVEGLHEPERNIRYGIWYLSSLEEEFHGNDILALAAYNAGRGNVQEWIETYGWPQDFSDIRAIPFKETRAYVEQVLNAQRRYLQLYAK